MGFDNVVECYPVECGIVRVFPRTEVSVNNERSSLLCVKELVELKSFNVKS